MDHIRTALSVNSSRIASEKTLHLLTLVLALGWTRRSPKQGLHDESVAPLSRQVKRGPPILQMSDGGVKTDDEDGVPGVSPA